MRIIRQGDVLLQEINSLPKGLKKKKDKIVQWGEQTFHAHQFPVDSKGVELLMKGEEMYLQIAVPSPLEHPEHNTLIIEPGMYKKTIEREWNYSDEALRKVVD